MLYLELFCKYNTLIRIMDYSAKKKSMLFVRHCENCERRGGSQCFRRLLENPGSDDPWGQG